MTANDLQAFWPIIAFVLGVLAVCVVFVVNLWRRVGAAEDAHKAHEDLCGERYSRIELRFVQSDKLTDERHEENVSRFDRLEDKIDRLLGRE